MSDTRDDSDLPEDDGVLDAQDTLISDHLDYDPLHSGIVPPDHWSPAEYFGTTAQEARRGESLDQLLAEEEPEPEQPAGDEVGEEYADELDLDSTDDL
ncbi:hypothetical protein [Streptomyces candidus]|uniref:DUF5709 domain-containing protein n=1 Tax=Streptomyces candidus TaxID=67283 RepID=A0A7X0HI48_9ACTN|nr:hypothetical protein [Streptomyces candidus]MBB6437913.1 hypothetical protein [Streptomyces candidus]GHH49763.1 hypothetical protein GCM10018773_45630 [Streptomyces candidus]